MRTPSNRGRLVPFADFCGPLDSRMVRDASGRPRMMRSTRDTPSTGRVARTPASSRTVGATSSSDVIPLTTCLSIPGPRMIIGRFSAGS